MAYKGLMKEDRLYTDGVMLHSQELLAASVWAAQRAPHGVTMECELMLEGEKQGVSSAYVPWYTDRVEGSGGSARFGIYVVGGMKHWTLLVVLLRFEQAVVGWHFDSCRQYHPLGLVGTAFKQVHEQV
jgi:hypothetical protein